MNDNLLTLDTEEEVMFYDTDCGGVVHNLAYLRMIETNRTRLGSLLGMDYARMTTKGRFAVVVRHEVDYIRPAVMGDRLLIHGWVSSMQKATFWCDFELRRASTSELLVKAHQKLALVQMPAGRPIRLPEEWREHWELRPQGG
ncbi:MAG: thioesterase family protein, partial [Akkermansia sp.]